MNIETHLILISAQAVPNITPILDEQYRPRKVVMLVSDDMRQRADWLESVIRSRVSHITRWPIANAWDIEHIRDQVIELLDAYPENIALNATGGTKPMSIAAYEVFRTFDKPIFYVHPEHDRIIWMHPADRPGGDLADRIKLPEFLKAFGAEVTAQGDKYGVPQRYRELTQTLILNAESYTEPLRVLNAYAAKAKPALTVVLDPKHRNYRQLEKLIELFQEPGLLELKGDRLTFSSEDARFYINGGWLEQHVWGVCLNLKKSLVLQDVGRSIEVERNHRNSPIRNEMDIALLKDNRLYIIECKTHHDKSPANNKNTQALYKLDSLKDLLGGLQARAMLVSYNSPNKYDLQRAHDLGISICAHRNLAQLSQKLTEWIR